MFHQWFGRDIGAVKLSVKAALEAWLDESNFDENGDQKRKRGYTLNAIFTSKVATDQNLSGEFQN